MVAEVMFLLSCGCKCSVSLPRVPWVGLWFLGFPSYTHMQSFKAVFPFAFWTTRILHGIRFFEQL